LANVLVVEKFGHQSNSVLVDLDKRTVTVIGPETLIVVVGQQLSWICAACRGSEDTLSYGHILFREVISAGAPFPNPIFRVKTEIVEVDSKELRGCWCEFLPGSVIAAGFPIRSRLSSMAGLEISLEIMSALGGIMNATQFEEGYVLKGRSIVFIPIKRQGDSVQWHFLKKDQGRISYKNIRSFGPTRLGLAEFGEKALFSTRAFLGWCDAIINHLGMLLLLFILLEMGLSQRLLSSGTFLQTKNQMTDSPHGQIHLTTRGYYPHPNSNHSGKRH